jgi:phosphopantothenoylcysteine decarboxylase/phosphopantothenate--cysteine ligase
MKKLKVLVTSGGTREYIDDIRVMTNISSGKLGAMIADKFVCEGHRVTYLYSKGSKLPNLYYPNRTHVTNPIVIEANTVNEVSDYMPSLLPEVDVMVHAMAISDFTFDRKKAVKCSSNDLMGFIEHMQKTIRSTPKIIARIKRLNPDVFLVGFKFEVGRSEDELVEIARKQIEKAGSDLVFANDKEMMKQCKNHIGFVVGPDDYTGPYIGKEDIAREIYRSVIDNFQ